jgi:hypothetical protein
LMLPFLKDWPLTWLIKAKIIKLSWLSKPISRKIWKTAKLGESSEESCNKMTKILSQWLVSWTVSNPIPKTLIASYHWVSHALIPSTKSRPCTTWNNGCFLIQNTSP